MYRVRLTGEVLSQGQVRTLNPNTSFPEVWGQDLLEELGLDPVFESPTPVVTRYQTASKDGVEQVDGKWFHKWSIAEMSDEDKEVHDGRQGEAVRSARNQKLLETDWVVVKAFETNGNVPAVWELYRQALRDIPSQPGFPWEVEWPTKP